MPNILTVSPSGSGHSNAIDSLKEWITSRYKNINWITYQTKHDYSYSQDPKKFVYYQLDKRVYDLKNKITHKVLASEIDMIIYDFFSPEALLLKLILNLQIPIICSIPAQIGHHFNDKPIKVSTKYNINLNKLILSNLVLYKISDGYHLHHPDTINIVWNFSTFKSYILPNPEKWYFLGSATNLIYSCQDLTPRFIYCSMGTVVPTSLYDLNPEASGLIKKIYKTIINLKINQNIIKVISCPNNIDIGNIEYIESNYNVIISENIAQNDVLDQAQFFITHGGGNSFQEAISRKVPLIVLPFFGDQHIVAKIVTDYGLGINLFEGIFSTFKPHTIDDLTPQILTQMIDRINNINETEIFNETFLEKVRVNFNKLNLTTKSEIEKELDHIFIGCKFEYKLGYKFKLQFKKGDLLYGTNRDRIKFIESCGLVNEFQIGKENNDVYTTFEELDIDYPKLIDQWNDLLRKYSVLDLKHHKITYQRINYIYDELMDYRLNLESNLDYITDQAINVQNENLLNICCLGMIYFLKKGYQIHIVLDSYNSQRNIGTKLEIDYLVNFLINYPRFSNQVIIWKRDNISDQWNIHQSTFLTINYNINYKSLELNYNEMLPVFQKTHLYLENLLKTLLDNFRSRGSENYWIQSRIKSFESYSSRIKNRIDDPNKILDLIGFRIIHPSSNHLDALIQNLEYYFTSHGYKTKRKTTHPTYLYINGKFENNYEQFVEIQFWSLIEYYGFINEYDLTYKSNYYVHSKLDKNIHKNLIVKQQELQQKIDQDPFWNILGIIEDEKAKLGVFNCDDF